MPETKKRPRLTAGIDAAKKKGWVKQTVLARETEYLPDEVIPDVVPRMCFYLKLRLPMTRDTQVPVAVAVMAVDLCPCDTAKAIENVAIE